MMNNIWNVALNKVEKNKLIGSQNNPSETGEYLCTCVQQTYGGNRNKYLRMMAYDKERNAWHDIGNKYGLSHNILAWTDAIKPCEFNDFEYLPGGYFVEKNNK